MKPSSLEELGKLWSDHPEPGEFYGSVTENIIAAAEKHIGYTFPYAYREFLSRFGAGDFGGDMYYGLCGSEYLDHQIPNAIWINEDNWKLAELPKNFFCVMNFGYDGGHAVLDLRPEVEGGGKVYEWFPAYGVNIEEPIADNFFEFIVNETMEAIEDYDPNETDSV